MNLLSGCGCITERLPNERWHGYRIRRWQKKIVDVAAEPNQSTHERRKNEWKDPIARNVFVQDLAPIARGTIQASASIAASLTSRLLKTC